MPNTPNRNLSGLEHKVLQVIWRSGPCTAEQARRAFRGKQQIQDSTIRTILRRLENKGFVTHSTEGRTYVYRHLVAPQSTAVRAVRQIIDRFCNGSVENLLLGMVEEKVLPPEHLRRIAAGLEATEAATKGDEHA